MQDQSQNLSAFSSNIQLVNQALQESTHKIGKNFIEMDDKFSDEIGDELLNASDIMEMHVDYLPGKVLKATTDAIPEVVMNMWDDFSFTVGDDQKYTAYLAEVLGACAAKVFEPIYVLL